MIKGDFLDRIKTRFKRGSLASHYRTAFDSPSGRIVLHDLVRQGGVMVTHGGSDTDGLQFEEGKRYIALYILGMLRIEPQGTQQLADREVFDE